MGPGITAHGVARCSGKPARHLPVVLSPFQTFLCRVSRCLPSCTTGTARCRSPTSEEGGRRATNGPCALFATRMGPVFSIPPLTATLPPWESRLGFPVFPRAPRPLPVGPGHPTPFSDAWGQLRLGCLVRSSPSPLLVSPSSVSYLCLVWLSLFSSILFGIYSCSTQSRCLVAGTSSLCMCLFSLTCASVAVQTWSVPLWLCRCTMLCRPRCRSCLPSMV